MHVFTLALLCFLAAFFFPKAHLAQPASYPPPPPPPYSPLYPYAPVGPYYENPDTAVVGRPYYSPYYPYYNPYYPPNYDYRTPRPYPYPYPGGYYPSTVWVP